jgi:hypothetical protein
MRFNVSSHLEDCIFVYVVYVRRLGRLRHRWEDNIEMDLKRGRMGRYGLDLSGSG